MLIPFLPDDLTLQLAAFVLVAYYFHDVRNGLMEWVPNF